MEDKTLKKLVEDGLQDQTSVNAACIGATVRSGVIHSVSN